MSPNFKGMWKPLKKPISKMTRDEVVKELRSFRNAWEKITTRDQDLSNERLKVESLTTLKKLLSSYYTQESKTQSKQWLKIPLDDSDNLKKKKSHVRPNKSGTRTKVRPSKLKRSSRRSKRSPRSSRRSKKSKRSPRSSRRSKKSKRSRRASRRSKKSKRSRRASRRSKKTKRSRRASRRSKKSKRSRRSSRRSKKTPKSHMGDKAYTSYLIKKEKTIKTDRPSPKYSATMFEEGYIMKGNDGNKWIVSVTSSGINRWKKL